MTIPNFRDQIKIVFFDIDDTLFVRSKDLLVKSVQPAIQKLHANGIKTVIATGRSRCSFPQKLNQMLIEEQMDTFVTINGQFTYHKDHILTHYPIDTGKLQKLTEFFEQQDIAYGFVGHQQIAVSAKTTVLQGALNSVTTNYIVDKNFFKNNVVYQMLPFYNLQQEPTVLAANLLDGLKTVRWHENSVDILDADGSKARGINAVLQHFGLQIENAMAFGDGLNDVEMFQTVGVGVAMGNAHDTLKEKADYITDHVEEHGVYNFLQKSGLID